MSDETHLIETAKAGGRQTADLLPLVYVELRSLASARLANEPPGHTLNSTALVHEVFVRLGGDRSFSSRSCFLRAAAVSMRRILIDHARAKKADKRELGVGRTRSTVDPDQLAAPAPESDLVAVDEAVTKLTAIDPQAAELVTLRYFGGMSIPEAAEALDISPRSADRLWSFARAWLFREISGDFLA